MTLDAPHALWLLALLPVYLFFAVRSFRKADRFLRAFARIPKERLPFCLSTAFFSLALIAVTAALAEPKIPYQKNILARSGLTLALGIDVSTSMLAEDAVLPHEARERFPVPSRLNRARIFALSLLSRLEGERIGIFIFAETGTVVVPPTTDYGYCRYLLQHFSEAGLVTPGSDLSAAVGTGTMLLQEMEDRSAGAVILLSDGEPTAGETDLAEAVRQAREAGIRICTVGVGRPGEQRIPLRSPDGTSILDYYLDAEGRELRTRFTPESLQRIARTGGGIYVQAIDTAAPARLMAAVLAHAADAPGTQQVWTVWRNLSPVFLLAGLVLFSAGIVTGR